MTLNSLVNKAILMIKLLRLSVFLFLGFSAAFAQEKDGQVLDFNTHEPIPYATIAYNKTGVITNETGKFTITHYEGANEVTISSLGYESLTLPLAALGQEPILLKLKAIDLASVYLANKNLTGVEIIERVKAHVDSNYNVKANQKRFFLRESNINTITQFDIQVDKSSIPELDQALMDSITRSVPKNNDSYIEALGDMYGDYNNQQLKLLKAADLYNPAATVSLDSLLHKLETIFNKNIKKDSYIKIRSGIIGVSVDADELSDDDENSQEQVTAEEKTPQQLEKEDQNRRKELKQHSQKQIKELLQSPFWKSDITFDLFENAKKYDFSIQGYTSIDGEFAYIINFEPRKRSSLFKGKLYVNTVDYGVYRIDFENLKPLSTFRLFGVATADDVYRGKMIYEKDVSGRYNLKYLERAQGESVTIDRPLTILEKNKKVAGRRKQNELDMDILFKNSSIDIYQLIILNTQINTGVAFAKAEEEQNFDYQKFKKYNPDFWKDYTIIEPDQAIKSFSLSEN